MLVISDLNSYPCPLLQNSEHPRPHNPFAYEAQNSLGAISKVEEKRHFEVKGSSRAEDLGMAFQRFQSVPEELHLCSPRHRADCNWFKPWTVCRVDCDT